ncbi:glutaminyl-peptide cyclotransferase [Chryseobacterium sp. c4a]|uniref:glutaminyl-peptide cyclotransferase n=1 Tax=Chryseobacterium sp. c4a TaxID=1573582 RepID=UPI0013593F5B|nr:glutaminyl-peptide cyclotransferase [Chryseobacterium sp. c4a]
MRLNLIVSFAAILLLTSCNKNKEMMNALADYNTAKESTGYHFGDKLQLPKEVTDNVESITISFMQGESSNLIIDPQFFSLGDNKVVFVIKAKNGETFNQDATINVFTKAKEKNVAYQIVAEYPHNPAHFIEGFVLEGNTVYESDGLEKESQLIKYTLGATAPSIIRKQPADIFSEGCTIVGNKVYQLTYLNKIGFVYDKNTLEKLSDFPLPNVIGEGWGLTYDGKDLVATDGSKYLYFLDVNTPSKVIKTVGVAGNTEIYEHLNELEYHKGFIYANIWHKPVIVKIDPKTGEVVERYDFTKLTSENDQGDSEHVLNGIAFKGDNMLVTGKNWAKIYEVAFK